MVNLGCGSDWIWNQSKCELLGTPARDHLGELFGVGRLIVAVPSGGSSDRREKEMSLFSCLSSPLLLHLCLC